MNHLELLSSLKKRTNWVCGITAVIKNKACVIIVVIIKEAHGIQNEAY